MRIAICSDQYLPLLSGAADSIELLAEGLRKRGHVVRIFAPSMRGATPDPDVVRLPAYMLPGTNDSVAIVTAFGMTRDLRRFKPDIMHTHFFGMIGLAALYSSRVLRVPLVGTNHTMVGDYMHYVKLDYAPFRALAWKFVAWYYNHCVRVTTPSRQALVELASYGMTRPGEAISNPIYTDLFHPLPDRAALKKKLGIRKHAVVIFGRVAAEKNLDVALDAFIEARKSVDAELVIVGDGPYRAELEKRAKEKAGEANVRFLGTLRGQALVEALNACEVCLITSLSETQSMTTLQALACGLSVVAANAGGLPEYVIDGLNGYVVDPAKTELFAERMVTLFAHPHRAQAMGMAGRDSVMKFSPDKMIERFEAMYKAALADAKQSGVN